jgi:hypothetical protein
MWDLVLNLRQQQRYTLHFVFVIYEGLGLSQQSLRSVSSKLLRSQQHFLLCLSIMQHF